MNFVFDYNEFKKDITVPLFKRRMTYATFLENSKYDQQHQARVMRNITGMSPGLFDTVYRQYLHCTVSVCSHILFIDSPQRLSVVYGDGPIDLAGVD